MTKTDQDHAAAAAGQRGEEGAGGDRGQVLSAAGRLRQGEHRQPGEDGQAADGEPEARPGRAHQASNEKENWFEYCTSVHVQNPSSYHKKVQSPT